LVYTTTCRRSLVVDYENFRVEKTQSKVGPGSDTLSQDTAPSFPSIITEPAPPSNSRLKITHPNRDDQPFVYRTWSPDKNVISLFGEATDGATVFIVNNTALRNRNRYHQFLGTRNIKPIPNGLPGPPAFVGIFASQLQSIFDELEEEQFLNPSPAPLGFARVGVDREGFWQSLGGVDLVHNEINEIFAFILINDVQFIFDSTKIDYRFLHAIMTQTNFRATEFTVNDPLNPGQFGNNTGNFVDGATIAANPVRTVGSEVVNLDRFYYGWRFKDRALAVSKLTVSSDLEAAINIADTDPSAGFVINEADAQSFITRVGYNVIQYRKKFTVDDWYVIDNCGKIMLRLDDNELHRVLPLPNSVGDQTALTDVLVDGGSTGSIIAQWALEKVTLNIKGEDKELGQIFRSPDGVALPANYVLVGPKPDSNEENFFGRPEPDRDSINVTVTFLRPQTAGTEAVDDPLEGKDPELGDEVVKKNVHSDKFILTSNLSSLEGEAFTAGSEERPNDIQDNQQDYVFIFSDSDGRPIGRKVVRFMCAYYHAVRQSKS